MKSHSKGVRSASEPALGDGGARADLVRDQCAMGLDRPCLRTRSRGTDHRIRGVETATCVKRLVVESAGRSRSALPCRDGRCPERGLGRDRPGPGTRSRSAVARGAPDDRSRAAAARLRARLEELAGARGRQSLAAQLTTPERGATLVLDRAHPRAGDAASGLAPAALRRRVPDLTRRCSRTGSDPA